ncbi:MAG: LURP-one-related/scramblase family protein [Planctomycetales bacterium]
MFAEVVKEFTWFKSKFTLDVPGPNDYEITGSFWEHEYSFSRQGRTVASVSKKLFALTDTYGIDIVSGEDDVAILATAVVVDLVCHDEQNSSNS